MITLIISALISAAHAENWCPVEKGCTKSWSHQEMCEQEEGDRCYETSACPPDECKVVEQEEERFVTSSYENVNPCVDEQHCNVQAVSACDQDPGIVAKAFAAVKSLFSRTERKSGFSDLDGDGVLQSYCEIKSYETVTVKVLKPDEAKVLAKRIVETARNDEIQARLQKKQERLDALKTCLTTANPTNTQLRDCLKAAIKESLADRLPVQEL